MLEIALEVGQNTNFNKLENKNFIYFTKKYK